MKEPHKNTETGSIDEGKTHQVPWLLALVLLFAHPQGNNIKIVEYVRTRELKKEYSIVCATHTTSVEYAKHLRTRDR